MGKEARLRGQRRNKALARWAQEDPERFKREWAKRIDSWAGLIWSTSKDRVFLSEGSYQELLKKYPSAKEILDSIAIGLHNGVHIYFDMLNSFKAELGSEVINEIMSHAKGGTLIGNPIFSVIDHAKKTLADCGEAAIALQLRETTELLSNECCRALAQQIGQEIYEINQSWEPKYLRPRKKRVRNVPVRSSTSR
jgi:hypothetical protein